MSPVLFRRGSSSISFAGRDAWAESKSRRETAVACLLKTENCVPRPFGVAPNGRGFPGDVR